MLFIPPQPGVADQGDFQRVMDATGLHDIDYSQQDSDIRFFDFVKSEYLMSPVDPLRFFGVIPTTSLLYPVSLSKGICKAIGLELFHTGILTGLYSILYVAALFLCLKLSGIKRIPTLLFFCFFSLAVLMDGNYLIWFNSLYGEPMMIIGLNLFIAAVLFISQKSTETGFNEFLLIIVAAFLFLGSKAQCITALPFISVLALRIIPAQSTFHKKIRQRITVFISLALLLYYSGGIYLHNSTSCGIDTKYNSVFYGILKNSEDPREDLALLGLSEDLAVEAGKHAYLPQNEYVKYIPWSEITHSEFYLKINNIKLVGYYLHKPLRLLQGMEYTASQSFFTGTFLGKYEKKDVEQSSYLFNRFTLWSDYGRTMLPKKLWFIVLFFLAFIIVSLMEYRKNRDNRKSRIQIELLWVILAISTFQFPLPYIGNGEADTAKQLFLFNYTFDILLIVACTWIFNKVFFNHIDCENN